MASERTTLAEVGIDVDLKVYPDGAVFLEFRQIGATLDLPVVPEQKGAVRRFVEKAAKRKGDELCAYEPCREAWYAHPLLVNGQVCHFVTVP